MLVETAPHTAGAACRAGKPDVPGARTGLPSSSGKDATLVNSIHIVGAGGIGCAVGYALRAAGMAVTFIDADRAKVADGRRHGVRVNRWPPLSADFVLFDDWQPADGGTVLLCTKCYDNAAVLERLPETAHLLPIQNGFDPALDAWGHHQEGIASFVSECRPGLAHTLITRRGKLHLGQRQHQRPESTELFTALRASRHFQTVVVDDILPYKHTKLLYNAAISPLAAAAGLDNGQLLSVPTARALFFGMLRENYAILKGAGLPLAKIGPFHPDTVQRILRHRFLAHGLAWAFYPSLRGSYCSMSGDLPKGRTEIDYYNGHLLALAGDGPCPLNRRVYELVKRMERERRQPEVAVLASVGEGSGQH
ncbi:MAG: ketopantoate reductase family protein [Planctomycetia bacterium]|nr:ketopantoate reductase family protein [Planctomycetia bacterium]